MTAEFCGTVTAVSRNDTYSFSKPRRDEIVLVAGLGVEGDTHAGVTVRHRSRMRVDPGQPNLRQVHLMHAELFAELRSQGYDVQPGQLGENVTTSGVDLLGLPRGTVLRFGPLPGPGSRVPGSPMAGSGGAGSGGAGSGGAGSGGAGSPAGAPVAGPGSARQTRPEPPAECTLARPEPEPEPRQEPAPEPEAAEALEPVLAAAARATLNPATAKAVATVAAAVVAGPGDDPRPAVLITGLRNPCMQINNFRAGLLKHVICQDAAGDVVRKGGVMAVVLRGGPIRPGDPVAVELPARPHEPLECV